MMEALIDSEGAQRFEFTLASGNYHVQFNPQTDKFEALRKSESGGSATLIDEDVQFDNALTIPGFMEIRGDIDELNFGEALYIGSSNPDTALTEARAIIAPHNLSSFGYSEGDSTPSQWRPALILGMTVKETAISQTEHGDAIDSSTTAGSPVASSADENSPLSWDSNSQTMTLHLGWSDQSSDKVETKLEAAGLSPDQFCLFTNDGGKGDVGFGFVIIETEAQLNAVLDYASTGSTGNKTFVNQVVLNAPDLTLADFEVAARKGDYGKSSNRDQDIPLSADGYTIESVVTDDPSKARALGPNTSFVGYSQHDDGLFTVTEGDMAVNMYGSGGRDFLVGTVTLLRQAGDW